MVYQKKKKCKMCIYLRGVKFIVMSVCWPFIKSNYYNCELVYGTGGAMCNFLITGFGLARLRLC